MAQPTPYTRQYDFEAWQALNPTVPLPSTQIEAEFDAINITLAEVLANLKLIQADDGEIGRDTIGPDQLRSSVMFGCTTPDTPAYTEAPTILAPADGAEVIDETPTITTDAFSTFNGNDIHAASQYQFTLTSGDYSSPLHDSGRDTSNLLSYTLPPGVLSPPQTVYYRVRHEGAVNGSSEWSVERSFTVIVSSATVIGIALVSTGDGSGTWQRVDEDGNDLTGAGYAFGGAEFDNHPVWGGITDETVDGQSMVKVPAFWYRVGVAPAGSDQAGKTCWWIGDSAFLDATYHPAFRASNYNIAHFWVGKYQGTDDGGTKVGSTAGVLPLVNLTIGDYRTRCQARNTGGVAGFDCWDWYKLSAIQMLALIEMGGSDSQTLIGQGRVSESSIANVDAADVAEATYRGIVGLWGNVRQWLQGLRTNGTNSVELWDRDGNKTYVDTGITMTTTDEWPVTMRDTTGTGYDLRDGFLLDQPDAVEANATWPDYVYIIDTMDKFPTVGGSWSNGSLAGLWCMYLDNAPTNAAINIGGRLAKVP